MHSDWVKENIKKPAQSDKVSDLLRILRKHQIIENSFYKFGSTVKEKEFQELFKAFFLYWAYTNISYPDYRSPATFVEINGYNTLLLLSPYKTRTLYINANKRFNLYLDTPTDGFAHYNCSNGYCAIYQSYRINHTQLWGKTHRDLDIVQDQLKLFKGINRGQCACRAGLNIQLKELLVKNPYLGVSLGGLPVKVKCSSYLIRDIVEFFTSEINDVAGFLASINGILYSLSLVHIAFLGRADFIGSECNLKLSEGTQSSPLDGLVVKNNRGVVFEFTSQNDYSPRSDKDAGEHFRKTIENFKVAQTFFSKKLQKSINFVYMSPTDLPRGFSKPALHFLAREDLDFRHIPTGDYFNEMNLMYQSESLKFGKINNLFKNYVQNLESASGILESKKRKKFVYRKLKGSN